MKLKRQYNQQPNIITKSTDEMTVIEKRIMYLVINRLETGINVNPDLFQNLEFDINFNELDETNYPRVKKAIQKLQVRAIKLIDDDNAQEFRQIIPFPIVDIKGARVKLTMMANIVPYFLELKDGFTKYSLKAALSLTSVYSQKMYELLSRWKDYKKGWSVSVDELKMLLNATNYKYAQFKQWCIDVATKEINEKTDLIVTWEVAEKSGRSVKRLHFNVKTKAEADKQEANEAVQQEVKFLSQLSPGQVNLYTKKLLNDYGFTKKQEDEIMSNTVLFNKFVDLESKIANGVLKNINNPTAYMASVLFKKK